jgi:hypothetical protein
MLTYNHFGPKMKQTPDERLEPSAIPARIIELQSTFSRSNMKPIEKLRARLPFQSHPNNPELSAKTAAALAEKSGVVKVIRPKNVELTPVFRPNYEAALLVNAGDEKRGYKLKVQ